MLNINSNRIGVIDGYRAVSVFFVIIGHLFTQSSLAGRDNLLLAPVGYLAGFGVAIFFSISGYVICRGLLIESLEQGEINISAFYIRRIFRIVPPLLIYVFFANIAFLFGVGEIDANSSLRSLMFLCNLYDCRWSVAHTWSLAFEEQFYLCFPLIFCMLAGNRRQATLFAIAILLQAGAIAGYALKHASIAGYCMHMSFIAYGVVAATVESSLKKFSIKYGQRVFVLSAITSLCIVLIPLTSYKTALMCIVLPVTTMLIVQTSHLHDNVYTGMLQNRYVTWFGRASYGIYLWQQLATGFHMNAGIVHYVAFVLLALTIAGLLFRFVDRPLIRVGRAIGARVRIAYQTRG